MGHSEQWKEMLPGLWTKPAEDHTRGRHSEDPELGGLNQPGSLALFTLYLIQQFRAEEAALGWAAPTERRRLQLEHQCLAREVRGLLVDQIAGQDVSQRVRTFVERWRTHQEGDLALWAAAFGQASTARPGAALPPQAV